MNENEHRNEDSQEAFDDVGPRPEPVSAGRRRWSAAVWIAVVAIVIVLLGVMVVLHTSGTFGPGNH